MLVSGAGVVINGVLYAAASDWIPPAASISTAAGQPGTAPVSMRSSAPATKSSKGGSARGPTETIPTGVYVATGTPTTTTTSTSGAMATGICAPNTARRGLSLGMLVLVVICV
jgi:hypothetical protein